MTRQVAGELGNGSDPHAARCGCDEARQKRPKKSRTVEIPLGERLRAQWTFEPVEIGCLSKATAMDMSRFVTRPWRPVGWLTPQAPVLTVVEQVLAAGTTVARDVRYVRYVRASNRFRMHIYE